MARPRWPLKVPLRVPLGTLLALELRSKGLLIEGRPWTNCAAAAAIAMPRPPTCVAAAAAAAVQTVAATAAQIDLDALIVAIRRAESAAAMGCTLERARRSLATGAAPRSWVRRNFTHMIHAALGWATKHHFDVWLLAGESRDACAAARRAMEAFEELVGSLRVPLLRREVTRWCLDTVDALQRRLGVDGHLLADPIEKLSTRATMVAEALRAARDDAAVDASAASSDAAVLSSARQYLRDPGSCLAAAEAYDWVVPRPLSLGSIRGALTAQLEQRGRVVASSSSSGGGGSGGSTALAARCSPYATVNAMVEDCRRVALNALTFNGRPSARDRVRRAAKTLLDALDESLAFGAIGMPPPRLSVTRAPSSLSSRPDTANATANANASLADSATVLLLRWVLHQPTLIEDYFFPVDHVFQANASSDVLFLEYYSSATTGERSATPLFLCDVVVRFHLGKYQASGIDAFAADVNAVLHNVISFYDWMDAKKTPRPSSSSSSSSSVSGASESVAAPVDLRFAGVRDKARELQRRFQKKLREITERSGGGGVGLAGARLAIAMSGTRSAEELEQKRCAGVAMRGATVLGRSVEATQGVRGHVVHFEDEDEPRIVDLASSDTTWSILRAGTKADADAWRFEQRRLHSASGLLGPSPPRRAASGSPRPSPRGEAEAFSSLTQRQIHVLRHQEMVQVRIAKHQRDAKKRQRAQSRPALLASVQLPSAGAARAAVATKAATTAEARVAPCITCLKCTYAFTPRGSRKCGICNERLPSSSGAVHSPRPPKRPRAAPPARAVVAHSSSDDKSKQKVDVVAAAATKQTPAATLAVSRKRPAPPAVEDSSESEDDVPINMLRKRPRPVETASSKAPLQKPKPEATSTLAAKPTSTPKAKLAAATRTAKKQSASTGRSAEQAVADAAAAAAAAADAAAARFAFMRSSRRRAAPQVRYDPSLEARRPQWEQRPKADEDEEEEEQVESDEEEEISDNDDDNDIDVDDVDDDDAFDAAFRRGGAAAKSRVAAATTDGNENESAPTVVYTLCTPRTAKK